MSDKLPAPNNVIAVPRDNAVRVQWDEVEGADGYILMFFHAEVPRVCIKKRYAQKNSKQVLGFFNGTGYLVCVRAFRYENGVECEGDASEKTPFTPISMSLKAQKVICMKTGEIAQIDWEYRNTRPYALFYSEDESIVDVDRNGIVKALAPGRTEIAIVAEGEEIAVKVYVDREQTMAHAKAVMMFTGDIMCAVKHQRIAEPRRFDFHDSFYHVRKIFSEADFSAGVLETTCYDPVPYEFEQLRLDSGAPNCNSPSSFLTAAAGAGFDMLVTANNHCCDTGYEGLTSTVDSIKQLGMYNLGTMGDNPVFRDINGIRVAFMAFTMITNNQERDIPEITPETMGRYSREYFDRMYELARGGGAEYVVVYQHWGAMNSGALKDKQELESQYMAMCGVDLIVGSHPHVIQEFRYIKTPRGRIVPCAYSLGNFISSQAEMNENRDSVVLRVELYRSDDEVKANISYIPCMSADSHSGVTVYPVTKCFNEGAKKAAARIKKALGDEIEPYEYRHSVVLSGSVILDRIFASGDYVYADKTPLFLSPLTVCGGEGKDADGISGGLAIDIEKSFGEYIAGCGADYAAVDFYIAASVSCYELDGTLYTGTKRFLGSEFYKKNKDNFTCIKPPFDEKFWKPMVKKYAEAVLAAFPSERIILFRHRFSDRLVKGGSQLRNIPPRKTMNSQLSAMEEYFISLAAPSVVNLSQYYFAAGDLPGNYEQEYFTDAYGAVKKIIGGNRSCVDTADPEIWFERVLNYYDSMTARSYQKWLLDMKNAADVIIAYTSRGFAAENKERLLKLKAYGKASLAKIPEFFKDDKGAERLINAAKIIRAVQTGDISGSYSFYALAFEEKFNILKTMSKLLSEKIGAYVCSESAERVFLLLDKPDKLEKYVLQLKSRTADIWGSYITKEIFGSCKNSGVGRYIFKQSPVLAYDNPVPAEVPVEARKFCSSEWRRKTVADAFARSGISDLRKEHSRWLVVDFYDVVCTVNEYMGELFEVDDFICRTDFYKGIKADCSRCNIVEKRTTEQCVDAVMRFALDMSDIYGENIVLIRADLKDSFISLEGRIEKLTEDPLLERKRRLISACEEAFMRQTGCAVIDISRHFYADDKFPLGGAHIVHYEHEFFREAGVYLSHILGGGRQRAFFKADENYIALRDLRLER